VRESPKLDKNVWLTLSRNRPVDRRHCPAALLFEGWLPGAACLPRGAVVDRRVDQSQVAATLGRLMGFKAEFAEQQILEETIA
jgi:hypothetical protein